MKLDFCADDIKFSDFNPRTMVIEVESKDHLRELVKAIKLAFPKMIKYQVSEYVRAYDPLRPERFVNKSEKFWKSDKILKSTNVNNARPAVALACDTMNYSSDTINWCDEAWYRDQGFTIIECSDLLVDDFQLDGLEDLNVLLFGG